VIVPRGVVPFDLLIQELPGREVVFSAPEYIGRAPDDVAGQLRTLLGEYINACFDA